MALERTSKPAVHAREQVSFAWLVDLTAHAIDVLQLDAGRCGRLKRGQRRPA
jgi:hypothetical protein